MSQLGGPTWRINLEKDHSSYAHLASLLASCHVRHFLSLTMFSQVETSCRDVVSEPPSTVSRGSMPRFGVTAAVTQETSSLGELLHSFVGIASFAIRRVVSYRDIPYVFLIMVSPLLHLLRFKGVLKTPVGKLRIESNDILRWSIYGVFKTRFCYIRMLESIIFRNGSRSTVLDVGANLGDFTMAISDRATRVISIEPGRENFDLLCSNLRLNSLKLVVPLNLAAHDSSGNLFLTGNGADLTVANFDGGEPTIGVTLDSILRTHDVDYVDVVKIDVQGHELEVLRGLSSSLKDHRVGLAIVEAHPHRGINASDIVFFMQPFGYRLTATDHIFGRPQLYFE